MGPVRGSRVLLAVYLGGVGGGLTRYGVTTAWPTPVGRFPWATLTVNTGGVFALAVLATLLGRARSPNRYLRPLLGAGFLGAFTTFASVMVSVQQLTSSGDGVTAGTYLIVTVAAGFAAGWLGLRAGRGLGRRRPATAS
ncbi:MAG: CrcB family protein [Frankiaceae bacterium]|jgi:CrcB protein